MSIVEGSDFLAEDPSKWTLVLHKFRVRRVKTAPDPGFGFDIVIRPLRNWSFTKFVFFIQFLEVTFERRLKFKISKLLLTLEKQALISKVTGDNLASGPDVSDVLDGACLPICIRQILRHNREEN